MAITTTQELLTYQLGDIYDAEHRFLEVQQEAEQQAGDQSLKDALQEHIEQARQHISNLEQVYSYLSEEAQRGDSGEAQALVSRAQEGIQEAQNSAVRDCLLGVSIIKHKLFEVASYRSLILSARLIEPDDTGTPLEGRDEIVELLEQNLRQDEEAAQSAEQRAQELFQTANKAGAFQKAKQTREEQEQQSKGLIDRLKGQ